MGVHWSQVLLVLGAVGFVVLIFGLVAITILRSAYAQRVERRRAGQTSSPPLTPDSG